MNKILQFSTLIVFQLLIGACQHLSTAPSSVQVVDEWESQSRAYPDPSLYASIKAITPAT